MKVQSSKLCWTTDKYLETNQIRSFMHIKKKSQMKLKNRTKINKATYLKQKQWSFLYLRKRNWKTKVEIKHEETEWCISVLKILNNKHQTVKEYLQYNKICLFICACVCMHVRVCVWKAVRSKSWSDKSMQIASSQMGKNSLTTTSKTVSAINKI